MGRFRRAVGEPVRTDIADISVRNRLDPGKALILVENEHVLAGQELRVDPGFQARSAAHVEHRHADMGRTTRDEGRRFHLAFQPLVREILAKRVQPSVEYGQIGNSFALAMITSPKRSRKSAPSMVRFTSTLRRSSSSR